jgi:hypothetical protein
MNIPASSEQQAWLLAKLPSHEEWQVWRCTRRRGGVSWALMVRSGTLENAMAAAQSLQADGDFASVVKVTVNPPPA